MSQYVFVSLYTGDTKGDKMGHDGEEGIVFTNCLCIRSLTENHRWRPDFERVKSICDMFLTD